MAQKLLEKLGPQILNEENGIQTWGLLYVHAVEDKGDIKPAIVGQASTHQVDAYGRQTPVRKGTIYKEKIFL